jgi:hypothetical protein
MPQMRRRDFRSGFACLFTQMRRRDSRSGFACLFTQMRRRDSRSGFALGRGHHPGQQPCAVGEIFHGHGFVGIMAALIITNKYH